MDENPYKAPVDGSSAPGLPILKLINQSFQIGCGLFVVGVIVVLFTVFTLPFFVDIRENPRHWDAVHAREKAKREAEKAAKSADVTIGRAG